MRHTALEKLTIKEKLHQAYKHAFICGKKLNLIDKIDTWLFCMTDFSMGHRVVDLGPTQ